MEYLVTATKKVGRPKKEIQFDAATRQRIARAKAHVAFEIESNIPKTKLLAAEMSTSNLISLLPKLMSAKRRIAVETVCDELVKRVNDN